MGIEVRGDMRVIQQGRRARLPPSSTWSMSPKSACPRLPTIKSVTLSNIRVFHRMTDWEDTIIRESKYRRIEYFDESRVRFKIKYKFIESEQKES